MKIVDRYVLGMFIRNYLISVMVLVGMYVALDMVFNFGNLTQSRSHSLVGYSFGRVAYDILDYYFYQSFFFYVQLSGMIAVLAAGFTLVRLSRFNETTALLAAGVPLLRLAVTVILAGTALNLALLPIVQEFLIPRMIPKLVRERSDIHETSARTFAVRMMQDDRNALFNAARYYPPTSSSPAHLEFLDVIDRDAESMPTSHLYADSAVWNEERHQWDLTNGKRVAMASPDQIAPPVNNEVEVYRSDITPEEIALNDNKDYIQFLPVSKINELLARPKSYGTFFLLRARHVRFTQPLVNVILLLLAISTVLTREPQRLKTAAAKCMFWCGLCMGGSFLAYELAGISPQPTLVWIWPALMTWLPILIYGPISVYLIDHIKS